MWAYLLVNTDPLAQEYDPKDSVQPVTSQPPLLSSDISVDFDLGYGPSLGGSISSQPPVSPESPGSADRRLGTV
jgi:hypothetical protein